MSYDRLDIIFLATVLVVSVSGILFNLAFLGRLRIPGVPALYVPSDHRAQEFRAHVSIARADGVQILEGIGVFRVEASLRWGLTVTVLGVSNVNIMGSGTRELFFPERDEPARGAYVGIGEEFILSAGGLGSDFRASLREIAQTSDPVAAILTFDGISAPPEIRAGGTGNDNDFRTLASEHVRGARIWQFWAILLIISSGVAGVTLFLIQEPSGDAAEIAGFVSSRAAASAAVLAGGIYASARASEHRRLADEYRGIAETLKTLYLEDDEADKQRILRTIALFRSGRGSKPDE